MTSRYKNALPRIKSHENVGRIQNTKNIAVRVFLFSLSNRKAEILPSTFFALRIILTSQMLPKAH